MCVFMYYFYVFFFRKMVRDIVLARKRVFLSEGKLKDSIESRLNEFLKKEILNLWPEGWMSLNILSKVCTPILDSKKLHKTSKNNSNISNNTTVNHGKSKDIQLQPLVPCSLSSSLSITPVPIKVVTTNSPSAKHKLDTNKFSSENISKTLSTLPDIEISKTITTSANVLYSTGNVTKQQERTLKVCDSVEKPSDTLKSTAETILEGKNIQAEIIPKQSAEVIELENPQNLTSNASKQPDHCHVIDLTGSEQPRRKPGPKSKTRYYSDQEKVKKAKHGMDEITGSVAFDQIIADSLTDINNYNHTPRDLTVNSSERNTSIPVAADYSKKKTNSGGDDIQSALENLNLLQKMSMSIESESPVTSSPVSVIAFNKNYSPKSVSSSGSSSVVPKSEYSKADFCTGFQDAFQKQLMGEVSLVKTPAAQPPSSGKNSYNRCS